VVEGQDVPFPLGESGQTPAECAENEGSRGHATDGDIRPARDFQEMNALATIAIFAAIIYRMWRLYGPVEVVNADGRDSDMPPDRQNAGVIP
jgi:hypothetical protein